MWRILLALLGSYAAYEILRSKDQGLSGISREDVIDKSIDLDIKNLGGSKSRITRVINDYANDRRVKGFKIGKTGQPYERASQYGYTQMILLGKSRNKKLIENLEAEYNEKYRYHPKNDNINAGSAGEMVSKDGYYYLYIVIR